MFNLFNKEKHCSVCGVSNKTTKIIGYDPSNRGEFPELGSKQFLCINHLPDIWIAGMNNFNGLAVCYLPKEGWNSYSYTTLDRAKDWDLSKKKIDEMDNIINEHKNTSCSQCSKKANFILYDDSLHGEASSKQVKPFCKEHFVKRIVQEIQSKDLSIDEINIPFGDKGLYMSGEY